MSTASLFELAAGICTRKMRLLFDAPARRSVRTRQRRSLTAIDGDQ
ncbi:hypothetical protein [Thiomonas sp.]